VAKPVELLQSICTVPGTDVPLAFAADASSRAPDGTRFRALRGVPILRSEEQPLVERPTNYQSGGVAQDRVDHMDALPGLTLFLGAGNSGFRRPRVIEVEYDLFRDTDVVADAHRLPFRSNSFDLFFAMNVFEHLRQPFGAAREALRVLKPGGEIHVHTAFLQPLHEAPAHYFNATEFGVREWFQDFEGVECTVSGNFNPLYAVSWLCSELLAAAEWHLGKDAARRIGKLTLAETGRFWSGQERERWNPAVAELFFKLPEAAQRPIAAGFELRAHKRR
jgi:SAM-dependent methyltransferase